jgi:hypothetical protein
LYSSSQGPPVVARPQQHEQLARTRLRHAARDRLRPREWLGLAGDVDGDEPASVCDAARLRNGVDQVDDERVALDRDLERAVRPHAAHGDDQRVLVPGPGRPSTIGTVSLARTLNGPRLSGGEGVRAISRLLIGAGGMVHLS